MGSNTTWVRWAASRRLDAAQLAAIAAFRAGPERWRPHLGRRAFLILHQLLVEQLAVQDVERRHGLAARSLKAVAGVLLADMAETRVSVPLRISGEDRRLAQLEAELAFVAADDSQAWTSLMLEHGLTRQEARLMLILRRAGGRVVSREALVRRLYAGQPQADMPQLKGLDVAMCHLRKKLPPGSIVTVSRVGYRWVGSDGSP